MTKPALHTKRLVRVLLITAFLLSGVGKLFAAPQKTLAKDSVSIPLRQPAKDKADDYYNDDFWKYGQDKAPEEESAFDRLWNGFWDRIGDSLRSDDSSGKGMNGWTVLLIVILAGLLVFAILSATRSGISSVFSGKSRAKEKVEATLEDVDIHEIDFEKEIASALRSGDYRLAVRLWFLRTLKAFSDKELVRWQIDKTNSDYYYELSGTSYQTEFGEVSNVYDYIWYGEFPVNETMYRNAEEKFRGLNSKIAQ